MAFFKFVREHPFIQRLLLDEIVNIKTPVAEQFFRRVNLSGIARVTELLNEGVEAGTLRPVNPLFYYLARIGLSEIFVVAGPIIRGVLGEQVDFDKMAVEYGDFICDLLAAGVARRPEAG
jgi:hypothetical protein